MGQKAPFSGVLVPELNYQNYKEFEADVPELHKIMTGELAQCADPNLAFPILWALVGFALGAIAFRK